MRNATVSEMLDTPRLGELVWTCTAGERRRLATGWLGPEPGHNRGSFLPSAKNFQSLPKRCRATALRNCRFGVRWLDTALGDITWNDSKFEL